MARQKEVSTLAKHVRNWYQVFLATEEHLKLAWLMAPDVQEQAVFLRHVASFLMKESLVKEDPEDTRRRILWIRRFIAERKNGPSFPAYESYAGSLRENCEEAEAVLAGSLAIDW